MQNKGNARILLGAICLCASVMIGGCSIEKTDGNRVADLEYTVVSDDNLPEELKGQIEEKKMADFKTTYEDADYLYIVRGYGEQETGGYSISVEDAYLTDNAICVKTMLAGPTRPDEVVKAPSYPYIVLKTEQQDKNVVFD